MLKYTLSFYECKMKINVKSKKVNKIVSKVLVKRI